MINQKISGIYKIINKVNGKYYVGSSKNIMERGGRWNRHKTLLNRGDHFNVHLQNAWKKYGKINFKFVVIEQTKELKDREQYYLNEAKKEECYNLSFTAYRVDITDEIKIKMSNGRRGKPSPNKGKSMSEKQKEKIRQSILKIRDQISETRAKDWIFCSPQKQMVKIHNLNKFCKNNNLQIGHMSRVYSGHRPHHKGWTKWQY